MFAPDQEDYLMIKNLYNIYKDTYSSDTAEDIIYFHKVTEAAKVLLSFHLPRVEYEALIGNQDEC